MPDLDWNPIDLITFLGVEPEVAEWQSHYRFALARNGLCLVLNLWPHESVFQIQLRQEQAEDRLMDFAIFVRGAVRYEQGDREILLLRDCAFAPSRFSYLEMGNLWDPSRYPYGFTTQIVLEPYLSISFSRSG